MMISRDRAAWLGRHVFPNEAALRLWLARRPAIGMDVEDVVQESYAILAALDRVDHIVDPRTYLFQVAKSVVLRTLRRARIVAIDAQISVELLEVPADLPSPERVAADRQELAHVGKLIAALPARCREVFTLRKFHGLSQRATAERLGIAESTVEKHMVKALARLTDAIGRGGSRQLRSSSPRDPGAARSDDEDRDAEFA